MKKIYYALLLFATIVVMSAGVTYASDVGTGAKEVPKTTVTTNFDNKIEISEVVNYSVQMQAETILYAPAKATAEQNPSSIFANSTEPALNEPSLTVKPRCSNICKTAYQKNENPILTATTENVRWLFKSSKRFS